MKKNLSRTITVLSVVLVIVVILNLGILLITMESLSISTAELYNQEFESAVGKVNDNLVAIHSMMLAELSSDIELDQLLEVKSAQNMPLSAHTTIKRVHVLMANWSGYMGYSVGYGIYYPTNEIEINSCSTSEEYEVWRNIKEELFENINQVNYKSGWQVMSLHEQIYLVKILQKNTINSICYINLDSLLEYLDSDIYGKYHYMGVYNEEGEIFAGKEQLEEDGLDPISQSEGVIRSGNKTLVLKESLQEVVQLILVVQHYDNQAAAMKGQLLLLGMSTIVIALIVYFIGVINRKVLYPIQKFNHNVESLKNNERYNLETHYQINELENASGLMNEMVGRIKKLRIDIYEKTLQQQKTQMDFLSLQIEPHFYLNCLNSIYSMAQMRQYAEIQKFSACVSVYLRYVFKNSEELVSVEGELEHIEKYLEIQKLRYQDGFCYHLDMDDKIKRAKLPSLLLHTFVENSLKYTVNWEDEIELSITGSVKEDARIMIEDTGPGFEPELLERLQKHEDIRDGEYRIGIMNAVARMEMIFGDQGRILFRNRREGGAMVEIIFPYFEEEVEKSNDTIFQERK